jgi:acetyltransferase-like isoleucine patch superfamily enzyme
MGKLFHRAWIRFWMQYSGLGRFGRLSMRLAAWVTPPSFERRRLARFGSHGFISPDATIVHRDLQLEKHVFIDDGVLIYQDKGGGSVKLCENAQLFRDTIIQTGKGGTVTIGPETGIQPRCQFSAYLAPIEIGRGVQIAPNCAFYPYNHGMAAGASMLTQPLQTAGGILIENDAWLGVGVIVLDGVRIGQGAVIGAGSVVTCEIPDGAIAMGVPARVVKMRSDLTAPEPTHR